MLAVDEHELEALRDALPVTRIVLAGDAPAVAPDVSAREFEELIDSSLRMADRVDRLPDGESGIKGEAWILRAVRWVYRPFRFRCAYHILRGELKVVYFQGQILGSHRWGSIRTTDEYREILRRADEIRRASP